MNRRLVLAAAGAILMACGGLSAFPGPGNGWALGCFRGPWGGGGLSGNGAQAGCQCGTAYAMRFQGCHVDPAVSAGIFAAAQQGQDGGQYVAEAYDARLYPVSPDFQGRGHTQYTVFDGQPVVNSVFTTNVRLTLVRASGAQGNVILGLTAESAEGAEVAGYIRREGGDGWYDYVRCNLVYSGVVVNESGVSYATYQLALKRDAVGEVAGIGACYDTADNLVLPPATAGDAMDIAVTTAATVGEVRPVLTGVFVQQYAE